MTAFLAGVARTVADKNVTINNILPGAFDTDRLRGVLSKTAEQKGKSEARGRCRPHRHDPGQALRQSRRIRRRLRVPVLGAGRLHHRAESADRRRHLQRRILKCKGRHRCRPCAFFLVASYLVISGDFLAGAASSQRYLSAIEMRSTWALTSPTYAIGTAGLNHGLPDAADILIGVSRTHRCEYARSATRSFEMW